MRAIYSNITALTRGLAFAGLGLGVGVAPAEEVGREVQDRLFNLERRVKELEAESRTLKAGYARSSAEAARSKAELAAARRNLEVLGFNGIADQDHRLVQATAELQSLQERNLDLEGAAIQLNGALRAYLKQTLDEDPEARAQLEAAIRTMENRLGFGEQPNEGRVLGELSEAKIVSIDDQSGMLVANLGSNQGARVGMQFTIYRGGRAVAEAIVTDTRPSICGLLVQQLDNDSNGVRQGDVASLKTTQQ